MRLEITAGPDAGKEIEPAGDRYTVGREDVDFLLGDDEVSRQHFELRTLPDGRIEISDLGSRNGTRVNGERLTGPRTLEGGEEIRVGVTTILVEAPPPPDPGATKVSAAPPPDPDATAAAAEVPPELRADEPGPDDVTTPQPVSPQASEPATPPPPSETETAPPPAAKGPPPPAPAPPTPPPPSAPGLPAPPPRQQGAPPPPPRRAPGAPPAPGAQASTGLRTTALVLSILGVLGGVFALIVVAVAFSLDLCDDVAFGECYEGSSGNRVIGSILSVLGAISSVAFLIFAIRYFSKSRNPQLVLITGIATVLLIAVGLAVI